MKLPRHSEIWLAPYMADRARKYTGLGSRPLRHVWLVIADHFEPFWRNADLETARRRVEAWRRRWPEIAERIGGDDAARLPCYTFFYPEEQYRPELIDVLAEMASRRVADVEVHIHHDREGREQFIHRTGTFCQTLSGQHGLLRKVNGRVRFGFIHGNWALDNSLPGGKFCGLDDEISVLRDLGCYADYTMPSGASPSQSRMVNTIYFCTDDPQKPKSYDSGTPVTEGSNSSGDLLMIPGPLGLRWRGRLLPRMETGEVAAYDPASEYRACRWLDLAPRIGEHAFLKLYTHGCADANLNMLLDKGLSDVVQSVRGEAGRREAKVHFVSAWQMYLVIEALNRGVDPHSAVSEEISHLVSAAS